MIFPSKGRGREAQTPTSSHLALIPGWGPRIDDVPSDQALTSIWVSNGERWPMKDGSGAGLSSQLAAARRRRRMRKHRHGQRCWTAGDAQAEGMEADS